MRLQIAWVSHGTGQAAGPDDIGYPFLKKHYLIGRKDLFTTMNRVVMNGRKG